MRTGVDRVQQKLLGIGAVAVPELDIGVIFELTVIHIDTFVHIDRGAEGPGNRIVDPLLGIGAVTIEQLNIGAIVRMAETQIQAFCGILVKLDRIPGKIPELRGSVMAMVHLDIGAIGGSGTLNIHTFAGIADEFNPVVDFGYSRAKPIDEPLLAIAAVTAVQLNIGAVGDIRIFEVQTIIDIDFGVNRFVDSVIDPPLGIGAVAIPQLNVSAICGIAMVQVQAFIGTFSQQLTVKIPALGGGDRITSP